MKFTEIFTSTKMFMLTLWLCIIERIQCRGVTVPLPSPPLHHHQSPAPFLVAPHIYHPVHPNNGVCIPAPPPPPGWQLPSRAHKYQPALASPGVLNMSTITHGNSAHHVSKLLLGTYLHFKHRIIAESSIFILIAPFINYLYTHPSDKG